jgi:hypothetical protein
MPRNGSPPRTDNAPSAREEADVHELGRRVGQHDGYQSTLLDDPAEAQGTAAKPQVGFSNCARSAPGPQGRPNRPSSS